MTGCGGADKLLAVLLLLFVWAASADPAPAAGERLLLQPPPDWKMAYHYSVPGLDVWEFLPRSQTLENWRDIITAKAFQAGALEAPGAMLASVAERARGVCAQVLHSPIEEGSADGYPEAVMVLLCLRDTTLRKGDLVVYRAILGNGVSYALSRTRRNKVYDSTPHLPEADLGLMRADLAGFRVCRHGHDGTRCITE